MAPTDLETRRSQYSFHRGIAGTAGCQSVAKVKDKSHTHLSEANRTSLGRRSSDYTPPVCCLLPCSCLLTTPFFRSTMPSDLVVAPFSTATIFHIAFGRCTSWLCNQSGLWNILQKLLTGRLHYWFCFWQEFSVSHTQFSHHYETSKSVPVLLWDGLVGRVSSLVIHLLWLTLSTVVSLSEYTNLWMWKYEGERLRSRRDYPSHCFQSAATCIIVSSLLEICQRLFIKLFGTLSRRTTSGYKLLYFQPKRLVAWVFPTWICLNIVPYLRYLLPALISQSIYRLHIFSAFIFLDNQAKLFHCPWSLFSWSTTLLITVGQRLLEAIH